MRTRKDDGLLHRWLPSLVILFGGGIAWGTVDTTLSDVAVAVTEMRRDIRAASDEVLIARTERTRLKEQIAELRVAADILVKLSIEVGQTRAEFARLQESNQRLWTLARTNQGNTHAIADRIRNYMGGKMDLAQPDDGAVAK